MKVTTESCIFGAWIPIPSKTKRILDVGAGTGLLSLMMAQRIDANIDAVEIDSEAANQCKDNFTKSKWRKRLNLVNCDIQHHNPGCKYDLVISNPPFFRNSYKSSSVKKNLAMHVGDLSFAKLLDQVLRLIDTEGEFAILLPYEEESYFLSIAEQNGLFPNSRLEIKNRLGKDVFRLAMKLSFRQTQIHKSKLIIRDQTNEYTSDFTRLLKPYYLKL